MSVLPALYRHSLALLTDLYQLTMAYGYWKNGWPDREAAFHLSHRQNPFSGGYTISCGLETVIDFASQLRFETSDLDYLSQIQGADHRPLFDAGFLHYLGELQFSFDMDAVPEGTPVFPHEPLLRMKGALLQCQILESGLLNILNFQSLVATKAARICEAAHGDRVIEFGLRRAQGIDGAISATRATFIGGCRGTSNVLAGKLLGIPVAGTHAHSWVMAHENEMESFQAYAQAMPNNCIFLVDTYDTLEGVRHAVEVGQQLRAQGHQMLGVRLDSGDLAWLSIKAREILDEAGLHDARIVASNDLDERLIMSLKQQGARIDTWGIGTRLVTAYDQPALGGVYKLGALRDANGQWQHRIKLSEQATKVTTPGILQVRRFREGDEYIGDMLYDELLGAEGAVFIDPFDPNREKQISKTATHQDLLVPIFRNGAVVYQSPGLREIQAFAGEQLKRLSPGIKRFDNPHTYPVGLEPQLHKLKTHLIREARGLQS